MEKKNNELVRRGPKPKAEADKKVPVTIWVPFKNKEIASALCGKIERKYAK